MVRITEAIIRKRPEYSYQKIEFVQDRCKVLQILLLRENNISLIENVHKLKRLEYLNLAAAEMYNLLKSDIQAEQVKYENYRSEQRARFAELKKRGVSSDVFWIYQMEDCPEVRLEKARRSQQAKSVKKQKENINLNKKIPLYSEDGQPINVNQANLNFTMAENSEMLELQLHLYKYLDSELMKIELNSAYVRIHIEQYIFQYVFPTEIDIDKTVAQRSKETGHLLLRLSKPTTNSPNSSIASDSPVREEFSEWKQTREYLGLDSENLPHYHKASADKDDKDDKED
ncbi:touch insensitive larva B [Carabus blaptoides fortunei]